MTIVQERAVDMDLSQAGTQTLEDFLCLNGSDGTYQLSVSSTWEGQPGLVFGGFTLAILLRAAGLECAAGRPVSLACQFVRPLMIETPIHIEVTALRRGRTSDLLHVSLGQSDKSAVEAMIRTTMTTTGPVVVAQPPFDLGEPTSFRRSRDILLEDGWERFSAFEDYFDIRADWDRAESDSFIWVRSPSGGADDDPFLEAARVATFLDQQAPAVLNHLGYHRGPQRLELPWGFTNLDLLVHFHKPRGTEWVCYVAKVIDALDGVASGQTQAWSRTGDLLATAHSQIAFFPAAGDRLYG